VIAGWEEVGDLSNCRTRDDVRSEVRAAYPDESNYLVGNWTGQLWRFCLDMVLVDLVVLPLKRSGRLAVGVIAGPYEYKLAEPVGFRHSRTVEWKTIDLDRQALESDLLASLGSLFTVCELWRYHAPERILEAVDTGRDPGSNSADDEVLPKTPQELVGKTLPTKMEIRKLIGLWGFARRGVTASQVVEQGLDDLGLMAIPPFTEGWVGSYVDVVPIRAEPSDPLVAAPSIPSAGPRDYSDRFGLKVGAIESANLKPASVRLTEL